MRYLYIILALFCCSAKLSAQVDTPRGGIAIPREEQPEVNPEPTTGIDAPSPFTIKPPQKELDPRFQIGADRSDRSPMTTESRFVNRGTEYEDRVEIKQRGESSEPYKGNQFFGEVRSNSQFVQVLARDFEYADGDRIKVIVNDRIIVPEIILTNDFKGIQLTLQPGFNKIDFEALNQGTSGPNTAEFRVYDDKEELISSNQWNLATGFKATIIVVKEEPAATTTPPEKEN